MLALDALTMLACGAAVVFLAIQLARSADVLADTTGLGRVWMGTILLAGATSLPELATDVSAVLLDAPDLAAGDLFGSSLTNLLLLGLLDVLHPEAGILRRRSRQRLAALGLSIALTALAGGMIAVQPGFTLGPLSVGSVLLVVLYLAGLNRLAGLGETVREADVAALERASRRTVRHPARAFGLSALGLLVVAPLFATAAQRFAEASGLGSTFVGTWLVALATSLPEFVSCFTAVRLGAPDLAVGNIFGSNAFNMIVFAPLDLLHGGSFYAGLDRAHLLTAGGAIALSVAAGLALLRRGGGRRRDPAGYLLVGLYALCLVALKFATGGQAP